MVRPLKYGEKTSVRSITIPDTMWENLPHPKSQWVVEAVRQFLEVPLGKAQVLDQEDRAGGAGDRVVGPQHGS